MPGKFEAPRGGGTQNQNRRRRRRRRRSPLVPILILLIVLAAVVLLLTRCFGGSDTPDAPDSTGGSAFSEPGETTQPPQLVSTATVSAQGDLLMHKGIINACTTEDGSYDFGSVFQYLKDYTLSYDYAVANLETTLGGPDYPYQGNPAFNCPDPIADAAVDASFDMLLTANNHCSDTDTAGIRRTLEQLRETGLEALGTQLSDEPRYSIVDINGIKIGMLCYTYATNVTTDGRPSFNFREYIEEPGLVNYFMENDLNKFYTEAAAHLANMEAEGAEATILYIHWGTEYELGENSIQNAIAQKMCDLGIDVIVGGHPHVVQPMELLESTVDPSHKTVCIYSLGNAVSNQMKDEDVAFASGHSEDGALFTVTFEKYSDGSVYLADTDVLPTWVNRHTNNGTREYNILPLDLARQSEWTQLFGLTGEQFASAQQSYQRTMEIVGAGLTECQTYLEQAKAERAS